jgi:hypothetical protein
MPQPAFGPVKNVLLQRKWKPPKSAEERQGVSPLPSQAAAAAMPPRARPTTPSRKGAGGKGEEDDEFGDSRVKKAAASGDADALLGDMEAMTMTDYNRWLVTESNWSMAEECRQQHIEGEQFRKARDDRNRERGQLRQQDTVEQMKEAKTKVDAHRRTNLEQGSAVKRDVIAWHAAAIEDKMQYVQVRSAHFSTLASNKPSPYSPAVPIHFLLPWLTVCMRVPVVCASLCVCVCARASTSELCSVPSVCGAAWQGDPRKGCR